MIPITTIYIFNEIKKIHALNASHFVPLKVDTRGYRKIFSYSYVISPYTTTILYTECVTCIILIIMKKRTNKIKKKTQFYNSHTNINQSSFMDKGTHRL